MDEEELFLGLFGYDDVRAYINDYVSNNYTDANGDIDEGRANAFAHAFGSAVYAQHLGPLGVGFSKALGTMREWRTATNYYYGWEDDQRLDTWIDMYNNIVGRQIGPFAGANDLSWDQIAELVDAATRDNTLIVASTDPRVPTRIVNDPLAALAVGVPLAWLPLLWGRNPDEFNGWPTDFYTDSPPVWTPPPPMTEEERAQLRSSSLQYMQNMVDAAERAQAAGDDVAFRRAWADLQNALTSYSRTFGEDEAAMAAVAGHQGAFVELSNDPAIAKPVTGDPNPWVLQESAVGGPYTGTPVGGAQTGGATTAPIWRSSFQPDQPAQPSAADLFADPAARFRASNTSGATTGTGTGGRPAVDGILGLAANAGITSNAGIAGPTNLFANPLAAANPLVTSLVTSPSNPFAGLNALTGGDVYSALLSPLNGLRPGSPSTAQAGLAALAYPFGIPASPVSGLGALAPPPSPLPALGSTGVPPFPKRGPLDVDDAETGGSVWAKATTEFASAAEKQRAGSRGGG